RFKSLFFVGVVLKTVPIFLAVIKVKGLPCLRYTHLVTPSGFFLRYSKSLRLNKQGALQSAFFEIP
ncbi:MAG: hypothetical protein AAFV71_20120, partial [Cyanobacteria bacterium J06633_8]